MSSFEAARGHDPLDEPSRPGAFRVDETTAKQHLHCLFAQDIPSGSAARHMARLACGDSADYVGRRRSAGSH
jgi:hypothetical protein